MPQPQPNRSIPWRRWCILCGIGLISSISILGIKSGLAHNSQLVIVFTGIGTCVGLILGLLQTVFSSPSSTPSQTLVPPNVSFHSRVVEVEISLVVFCLAGIAGSIFFPNSILASLFGGDAPLLPISTQIVRSTPQQTPMPSPIGDSKKAMALYQSIIEDKLPDWADNLNPPENSSGWTKFLTSQGGCGSVSAGYGAYAHIPNYVGMCFATNIVHHNFAYQVLMTLKSGDGGGLIFRANIAGLISNKYYNAPMYRLDVRPQQQLFDILVQEDNGRRGNPACDSAGDQYCKNFAIHTLAEDKNQLTVIAQESNLYFFVNGTFLEQISNATTTSGVLGVFAVDQAKATDVIFDSAQVWNLP